MGMTIDDCVKELLLNKEDDTYVLTKETADFAIETMRKYQQLQADIQKALKEGSKDISENVLAIVREEYISKADYENRLKANMVTMLTCIQKNIEAHKMTSGVTNQGTWNECIACCSRIIQHRINALKAETEEV